MKLDMSSPKAHQEDSDGDDRTLTLPQCNHSRSACCAAHRINACA